MSVPPNLYDTQTGRLLSETDFVPTQRALPLEELASGDIRAIPPEQLSAEAAGQAQMPFEAPQQQQLQLFDIDTAGGYPVYQYEAPLSRMPDELTGTRIPDITAEELMARQELAPGFEWQPSQVVGDPIYQTGKREGKPKPVFQPDVTKPKVEATEKALFYQPRLEIGADIQNASMDIPFSDRVTEAAKPIIDKLIVFKEQGRDLTNPGNRRWHTQWTKEVAEEMFGEATPANVKRVTQYIDNIGQQELPFEDFGSLQMNLQSADWGSKLDATNTYYRYDETSGDFVLKQDRPLPPTKKGWKGNAAESDTSGHMNKKFFNPGKPATSKASQWVQDINIADHQIVDEGRSSIKEMAGPSEINSHEGKNLWKYITGQMQPAWYKAALRRFDGAMNLHDGMIETVVRKGGEELQKLGWLDDSGRWTLEAVGTYEVPGPIRILYRTLHDPQKWMPQLEMYGPDAVRQYHNLRALADWEQYHRLNSDMNLMKTEDYFYRGWKKRDGITWNTISGNITKLGRTKPMEMARNTASFTEMEELGFEPLSWDPYTQAMLSSKMGLQQRLQIQLLEILKDPALHQARWVDDVEGNIDIQINELKKQGWATVDNVGPAFKGDKFMGVPIKFVDEANPGEFQKSINGVWMFPKPVANALKEMFGGENLAERIFKAEGTIPVIGVDIKFDDIVYIPKQAKLFGSLFQQADFSGRMGFSSYQSAIDRLISSMQLLGRGEVDKSFNELLNAFFDIARLPKNLLNMVRANVDPKYRSELAESLQSTQPFWDDPELAEYTWANAQLNGLEVRDYTILPMEEGIELTKQAADELAKESLTKQGALALPRATRNVNSALQSGLFDGLYVSAIMTDFRYHTLPMVMRAHPDLNPSQIMGEAARLSNIKWSVLPPNQSTVNGWFKSLIKRFLFSLTEQETFARQNLGMFFGENKRYWRTYYLGGFLFTSTLANLVHWKTTGEPLPVGRYFPYVAKDYNHYGYGMNTAFLSPDVAIPTRGGDRALLDLLLQNDFLIRLLDPGSGAVPFWSFVSDREGTAPNAISNQFTSKDYMGASISKWGWAQRGLQLVYDTFAPIGLGQLAIHQVQQILKDKKIPALSAGKIPIVREGATAGDLLPSVESGLGTTGIAIQGLGMNLRSYTNEMLADITVKRTFGKGEHPDYPGLVLKTIKEVKEHPDAPILRKIVLEDPQNRREIKEIDTRRQEGATGFYDDFGVMIFERQEKSKEKKVAEVEIVNRNTDMLWDTSIQTAWSPTTFKAELKALNAKYTSEIELIEEIFARDPATAEKIKEMKEAPDRAEAPLQWAIWKFFEIRRENTDPVTGKVDNRAFDKAWEIETSGWDDEEMQESGGLADRFDAWLNTGDHHPFVQEYYDTLSALDKAGYWEDTFPEQNKQINQMYAKQLAEGNTTVEEIWSDYLSSSVEERRRLRASPNYVINNIIKSLEFARKVNRYNVVIKNPHLDRGLIKWFGNTPSIYGNREYYNQLYGKLPSTVRQSPYRLGGN